MDPAVISALTDSVRELEQRSCAEVVLEVRSRSGSYAHADARFASLIAFLALLVLLFSPWHFAAGWVAVDVAAVWVAGLFISRKSDSGRRLVTKRNCGAPVRLGATGICDFCGGKLTTGELDWVLSRIEQDEAYSG